ncbi:MAG: LON peptidase substrate-binding domain-containing protein, partial [Thermoanaerobaculia bacterium]
MSQTLPEGEFRLPLFPLPGVVFLPKPRLPLHVFEPRYRQLVNDVMRGEQRIGMVMLKPGWENDYYGSPPIYSIGTAGFVEQALLLESGQYEVVLGGVGRVRILEEISTDPYRVAIVTAAPEELPSEETGIALRSLLAALAKQYLSLLPEK